MMQFFNQGSKMDLISAMRFFSLVSESASFSEASEKLGVAPSSVSRKLVALEAELGTKLLDRNTRNMRLTEAGARFLQRSKPLLNELDEIQNELLGQRDTPFGTLRLSVPVVLAEHYIAPLLQKFHAAYPDIKIDLIGDNKIIDLLQSDIDVSIRVGQLKDSQFISRYIGPINYCLCASKAYLERHGEPKSIRDLSQHNCLSFKHPVYPSLWAVKDSQGQYEEFYPKGSLVSNSEETLLQAVRKDLGMSLIIDWHAQEYIDKGELQTLMSDHQFAWSFMPEAEINLVYAQREYLPEKIRCFLDFMLQEKRGH